MLKWVADWKYKLNVLKTIYFKCKSVCNIQQDWLRNFNEKFSINQGLVDSGGYGSVELSAKISENWRLPMAEKNWDNHRILGRISI